jgi:hypothetical protein
MKSIVAVVVVGTVGFFATAFDPSREMWAPLIVSVVPILVFIMWPVSAEASADAPTVHKKAA